MYKYTIDNWAHPLQNLIRVNTDKAIQIYSCFLANFQLQQPLTESNATKRFKWCFSMKIPENQNFLKSPYRQNVKYDQNLVQKRCVQLQTMSYMR